MTSNTVSVDDLIGHPQLRMRYLAGSAGGRRTVLWAQSCEQDRPWEWIGTGDLLLSTGSSFPPDPHGQVESLRALSRTGVAGIVLGEGMSPPLAPDAATVADQLDFPVLEAGYSVPWVLISRTVADLNSHGSGRQLRRIVRMYDLLRSTLSGDLDESGLMGKLERETHTRLAVISRRSGEILVEGSWTGAAEDVAAALRNVGTGASGRLPAYARVEVGVSKATVLPLDPTATLILVATPMDDRDGTELTVLEHAATIVSIFVQRLEAEALRIRESGQVVISHLRDGGSDSELLTPEFESAGLHHSPWRVGMWMREHGLPLEDLQWRLARRGIPYLVGTVGATIVVIAPAAHLDETFLGLAEDPGLQAGLSETFSTHREATDALREAKWGLEAAQAKGGGVVVYGRSRSPLLPRTVAEGQALVQWTLGSLFAYDDAHGTELVTTLATWFYHNRSVKQTAEFLGIHRQTLAYRLGRIEQITGRMLGDLADQTELFLAIKSYRLVGRPSG